MSSNLFSSKSCISKEENCNFIKPYSNLDYNNLELSKTNKNEFEIQYN